MGSVAFRLRGPSFETDWNRLLVLRWWHCTARVPSRHRWPAGSNSHSLRVFPDFARSCWLRLPMGSLITCALERVTPFQGIMVSWCFMWHPPCWGRRMKIRRSRPRCHRPLTRNRKGTVNQSLQPFSTGRPNFELRNWSGDSEVSRCRWSQSAANLERPREVHHKAPQKGSNSSLYSVVYTIHLTHPILLEDHWGATTFFSYATSGDRDRRRCSLPSGFQRYQPRRQGGGQQKMWTVDAEACQKCRSCSITKV